MPQVTASELRDRRVRLGLTLAELAAECTKRGAPATESAMSRIERGIHVPRPGVRKALADVLDLDVTDFERVAS